MKVVPHFKLLSQRWTIRDISGGFPINPSTGVIFKFSSKLEAACFCDGFNTANELIISAFENGGSAGEIIAAEAPSLRVIEGDKE